MQAAAEPEASSSHIEEKQQKKKIGHTWVAAAQKHVETRFEEVHGDHAATRAWLQEAGIEISGNVLQRGMELYKEWRKSRAAPAVRMQVMAGKLAQFCREVRTCI